MDRIDAMQAFVAVAELKGFAPAAKRMKISASAMTRMIAALEERLQTRLLQRTTRSVTLTDAGARYLERARRILLDVAEAESNAQSEKTEPRGRFVLSAPVVFGRLHVASVMCEYLQRYPQVAGELMLADHRANLIDEGLDATVRIGRLSDSSLIARPVGATRRVVVGSPKYLRAQKAPKKPTQLSTHRIIQCTAITASAEWKFFKGTQEQRVTTQPTYRTNSADAAIFHAERDGGLTMVLAYQVAEAVKEKRLAVVLEDFEPAPLPIHVLYPSTRLLSAKVRAFVELIQQSCAWQFTKF